MIATINVVISYKILANAFLLFAFPSRIVVVKLTNNISLNCKNADEQLLAITAYLYYIHLPNLST